ncbi:MAG: GGDEF domain-containing protein [Desulfobulbaceae bacterium]|nr:GGDEF domain-containing protein [Desulfobulbaceae bacterium]
METFKWGSQFLTGIPQVDEQHQSLVSMVNNFGKALSEDALTEELLLSSFKELAEYAQIHFETEEQLMTDIQLDLRHISSHLVQHSDFVNDITNLIETIKVDNQDDCRSLFEYLVHWLAYHILGSDKNMARQIRAINNGMSPEDAYRLEEKELRSSTQPLLVALNGLFALVSKRNKALVELNQTLEERVIERTKELSEANKALEVISITDHLTQLPNRRFAMSQLEFLFKESIRLKLPLSCLMIDADNFKTINDTYGHDAGDIVIQRLAKELQHSVRTDDIVCRLGGDEFFVICPNTNLAGALQLGEHIRSKVAAFKITVGEGVWYGSVSIGAACADHKMKDIGTLIKAADESVYLAKKDGRNCVRSNLQLQ